MNISYVATFLFALAIIHTFFAGSLEKIARDSKILHYLSEVELIFPFWSIVFLIIFFLNHSSDALVFFTGLNFRECLFVFVIMCMSSNHFVIASAKKFILGISKIIPLSERMAFFVALFIMGPLLGSFITEPGAMTVSAILLERTFYRDQISLRFKYAMIALLFVNVSIGGTLTHFAAPPVLMVAAKWHWDSLFMFTHFGWKAALGICINTALFAFLFRKELRGNLMKERSEPTKFFRTVLHLMAMAIAVVLAHQAIYLGVLFLVYVLIVWKTEKKDRWNMRESFMVGLFLAGLVVLGSMQAWWLKPILSKLSSHFLFIGSALLTSVTDNAAITYLGSLGELSDPAKFALVAGAVTGGGLTVIANAPNPAGFGILKNNFPDENIEPLKLFLWALVPTIIAAVLLYLL